MAAHEVKNPLQTILMGIHFLTRNLEGPHEESVEALDEMKEAVQRASSIIQGRLELASAIRG